MLEINGSFGEGGGQILRTALSLSCNLKKPFRIISIRANRKNPGLRPQHITCVRAAQLISGAEVKGDSIGSSELVFIPGNVQSGHYKFDIGTAGSTSLVLLTVLLPLCFVIPMTRDRFRADDESEITITGGTHVPWSPSFHYLKDVFLPFLKTLGVDAQLYIEKWGFYPKGGGIIRASIKPIKSLLPVKLEKRGDLKTFKGLSAVGNLPLSIAERQKTSALKILKSSSLNADIECLSVPCIGKGTFFFLSGEFKNSSAGFSSLGKIGKKAEDVGKEAAEELVSFLSGNAVVEKRLSDQAVPFLALSKGKSSFTTSEITKHLLTNIWVVKKFLDVNVEVSGKEGEEGKVIIYQ